MTPRSRLAFALTAVLLASAAPSVGAPRVVFDEGHSQQFLVGRTGELDLSRLATAFRSAGAEVGVLDAKLTAESLDRPEVLVIAGAFAPLGEDEVAAVTRFVEQGGRLLVLLHIAQPVAGLLDRLGVVTSNGVIRDPPAATSANPIDFRVVRLAPHPLTRELTGFDVYGCWALLAESPAVAVLAETSPHAWIDLDRDGVAGPRDARQAFAVAVTGVHGSGRFAVFGDDTMFQNRFLHGDNLELANRLADWLLARRAGRVAELVDRRLRPAAGR